MSAVAVHHGASGTTFRLGRPAIRKRVEMPIQRLAWQHAKLGDGRRVAARLGFALRHRRFTPPGKTRIAGAAVSSAILSDDHRNKYENEDTREASR